MAFFIKIKPTFPLSTYFKMDFITFADSIGERAMSAKNSADAEAARYRDVL